MATRIAAIILLTMLSLTTAQGGITLQHLRCEYRLNPLGIDALHPRLSWMAQSTHRGEKQTAYQLLVATSAQHLAANKGDLWDTGKVQSPADQVEYAGRMLTTGAHCWWKVRVFDANGKPSAYSAPSHWTMGLLAAKDWKANWIGFDSAYNRTTEQQQRDEQCSLHGLKWVRASDERLNPTYPNTTFYKRFDIPLDKPIKNATLCLYAFNRCDVALNGARLGTAVHWDRALRLPVESHLKPGMNFFELTASHTDPYPPAIIGKLVIVYANGETVTAPIDRSWVAAKTAASSQGSALYDPATFPPVKELDGTPWNGPKPVADLARVPAPYLRRTFTANGPIKRATAYVTALGVYEFHLNGKRVGDDVLSPGWTEYRKRVYYRTYDVTPLVKPGPNAVGAILGDGWYASTLAHLARRNYYGGRPRLRAQIVIEYANGKTQTIGTDGGWTAAYGPILHADLLMGCEYDTRHELTGWDTCAFNGAAWKPVDVGFGVNSGAQQRDVTSALQSRVANGQLTASVENDDLGGDPAHEVVKSLRVSYTQDGVSKTAEYAEHAAIHLGAPGAKLAITHATYGPANLDTPIEPLVQAAFVEPSRVIETLPAKKLTQPRPGCWVFDLGQNMVGWARIKVEGAPGQRVTVRHAEMLNSDGTIYTANLRSCPAADFYILNGEGSQTLEPKFTFHGFRYVELSGLVQTPDLEDVTGVVAHTVMERTGSFECSNPLLNQLYRNIIWGQRGNYLEVPTDCPQRDERMGWTGDTQFFAPTAAYNFNVAPFFTRWLTTCRDDQKADGSFPNVVPDIMGDGGATAWGDAALLCAYNIYHVYGDTRLITDHFDAMDRYMRWLDGRTSNGITHVGGFGDWLNAGGGASGPVIDTAYHFYLARLMTEMATAIHRTDAAAHYAQLAQDIKAAFARDFFLPDGSIKDSSQTAYALAFTMGLTPDDLRDKVIEKFVAEIQRFDWHLATGFIGTPRLLPALHLAGRDDVAYRVLLQETYPGWLFPVKNGATTMWERWNGWTPDGGFGDISMNSYNHYAFGAVGEYLYGTIGGIKPLSAGYDTVEIAPIAGDGVSWARTSFQSRHGLISTDWKRDDTGFTLHLTVPMNTLATVRVPTADASGVTEGGKPVSGSVGVRLLRTEAAAAVYEVGSGTYVFHAR